MSLGGLLLSEGNQRNSGLGAKGGMERNLEGQKEGKDMVET